MIPHFRGSTIDGPGVTRPCPDPTPVGYRYKAEVRKPRSRSLGGRGAQVGGFARLEGSGREHTRRTAVASDRRRRAERRGPGKQIEIRCSVIFWSFPGRLLGHFLVVLGSFLGHVGLRALRASQHGQETTQKRTENDQEDDQERTKNDRTANLVFVWGPLSVHGAAGRYYTLIRSGRRACGAAAARAAQACPGNCFLVTGRGSKEMA